MAYVVVVGAGLGGLATAARLAKLGHRVTVCERGSAPGGLLRRPAQQGFVWDATPFQTTMPAVLRDLFRKSGRPLERYVDLQLGVPARRHVFADGSALDLPTASRAAQLAAVTDAIGTAAGAAWTQFVDGQADTWERLRPDILEPPGGPTRLVERQHRRALHPRRTLDSLLRKSLGDERLRLVAGYPAQRTGRAPTHAPAFTAVESYLERTFGVWRLPAGAADLSAALLTRMTERSVDVRLDCAVTELVADRDRVTGVRLSDGSTLPAALVVTAVAPAQVFERLLPHPVARAAAELFAAPAEGDPRAGSGARPPRTVHLGLAEPVPDLPDETVLHGDPPLVVARGGAAPPGHQAWTVTAHRSPTAHPFPPRFVRSRPAEETRETADESGAGLDVLDLLAERGLDVRAAVVTRLDAPARAPSYPPHWQGGRTAADRAELARPLTGLHCLGTGLVLGCSVPFVAWQGAHVAELLGKA